jgi:hypothetical protein
MSEAEEEYMSRAKEAELETENRKRVEGEVEGRVGERGGQAAWE